MSGEATVPCEGMELTFEDCFELYQRGVLTMDGPDFMVWLWQDTSPSGCSVFLQFVIRRLSKRNYVEGHSGLHKDGGNWKFSGQNTPVIP